MKEADNKKERNVRIVKRNGKEYKYYIETFYYLGKQYTVSGKTPKEAIIKADRKQQALERGEIGISGKMTVKRWAEEWLKTYKSSVGSKAYEDYKRRVDNIIVPEIGPLRLTEVKDVHLQKLLNSRQGLSQSDIDKTYITIHSLFKRARMSRLIPFDPSEALEKPEAVAGTHRAITDFERLHILKVAETHPAGLWVKTMLYCGLRPGETAALSWNDVDPDAGIIHVKNGYDDITDEVKVTKSASGVRDIRMPDLLKDDFIAALPDPSDPYGPVFKQRKGGGRLTKSSRRKLWESFKNEVDLSMGAIIEKLPDKTGRKRIKKKTLSVVAKDLTPYCLRHTFGTDLQDSGVELNVIRYLMGHADIHVTSKIYVHTTEYILDDALDKLNKHHNENNDENKKEDTKITV